MRDEEAKPQRETVGIAEGADVNDATSAIEGGARECSWLRLPSGLIVAFIAALSVVGEAPPPIVRQLP